MISDAAVEAAARAMAPAVWGPSVWQFRAHGETATDARNRVQQQALQDARAALEAAAPHIIAEALEAAAEAFGEAASWSDGRPSPEQVQRWLKSRAAAERGQHGND